MKIETLILVLCLLILIISTLIIQFSDLKIGNPNI